jgi:peptidoglycan/LPS O-acetylase OafA/YrhL
MQPKERNQVTERLAYYDVLRALAIFAVVGIHSSDSGLQFSEESIGFNFTVLWRNILNFAVPMFLAISGFFLAKKTIGTYGDYVAFLRKQIPRVYVPFLIWSLVWLAFAVLIQDKSVVHEIIKLVVFQSSGPYYFIALIMQYYLLLPVLKKLANAKGLAISMLVSMAMTFWIFYLRYHTEISLPLILYAGNFATWQMFFVLGLYLGTSQRIRFSSKYLLAPILIFYILSCIESYVLIGAFHQAGDAVTAVKASSFMYSFFLIIFLFKNHDLIKSKLLKEIGVMSFGIYLTHMFALMGISRMLSRLHSPLQSTTYAYQLFLAGLVMLSCFLCISVFNRVFSDRQARLLGFK